VGGYIHDELGIEGCADPFQQRVVGTTPPASRREESGLGHAGAVCSSVISVHRPHRDLPGSFALSEALYSTRPIVLDSRKLDGHARGWFKSLKLDRQVWHATGHVS
jgi:hypothetical protein